MHTDVNNYRNNVIHNTVVPGKRDSAIKRPTLLEKLIKVGEKSPILCPELLHSTTLSIYFENLGQNSKKVLDSQNFKDPHVVSSQ